MAARILIVEDEQIIAADLRNHIRRLGHEVVGMAIAGDEAIAMAQEYLPDLVLMDVKLEGEMSGTDAAKAIQERTGAPVVFITEFPGVFVREPENMRSPGICLSKPFSRVQVEAALNAVLGVSSRSSVGLNNRPGT